MNNKRRGVLAAAMGKLDEAKSMVESALDEEQECFDNMPESLQESERGERLQEAVETLERVIGDIDSALDGLSEAMS